MTSGDGISRPPKGSWPVTVVVGVLTVVGFVLSFLVQCLVALLTSPLLLPKFRGGRYRFQRIQSIIWRFMIGLFTVGLNPVWHVRIRRAGKTVGPPKGQTLGSVIFCNHRSNADPFMLAWAQTCCCIQGHYIYKSSLKKVPFAGCNSVLAGDLAVHFGDKAKIKAMIEEAKMVLRRGENLIVFPEGTRSPSGILQDFKPTFLEICAELGCPVVPACVLGTERIWPTGGFKLAAASALVVIGEAMAPGPGGGPELGRRVAEAIRGLAQGALEEGDWDDGEDPLLTERPYPWWSPPPDAAGLEEAELLGLLRQAKLHERGARIA